MPCPATKIQYTDLRAVPRWVSADVPQGSQWQTLTVISTGNMSGAHLFMLAGLTMWISHFLGINILEEDTHHPLSSKKPTMASPCGSASVILGRPRGC